MSTNMLEHALEAHRAGLCVVPPCEDGSKRPAGEWAQFQSRLPTNDELTAWYANGLTGMGIVAGEASGGVEVFEFDDRDAYTEFKRRAEETGLGELVERIESGYLEQSPNGFHWLYRAPEVPGNTKLAQRLTPGGVKVLIETRGEGGYVIVAPTHGTVHPSGRRYELLKGNVNTIATITADEHEALWTLARSFDEMPVTEFKPSLPRSGDVDEQSERPGDYFNRTRTWADVLEPMGWTLVYSKGEEDYWRRPAKTSGSISATTNYQGSDMLKVFSSSTPLSTEYGYSKFSAYGVLHHGGDFKAAAKEIAREMPTRTSVQRSGHPFVGDDALDDDEEMSDEDEDEDIAAFLSAEEPKYDWLVEGLIERGDRFILTGPEGGGKSTLFRQMAVQLGTGTHPFTLDDIEPVKVLLVDLENSRKQMRRSLELLWSRAGTDADPSTIRPISKPDGINLANAGDVAWLERRLQRNRPDVVFIGPLYKMADGDPSAEEVAKAIAVALDRLRSEYGFALCIEAHTPHSTNDSVKRPYGASLWKRWPEFGIYLSKTGLLTHWRGARDEREWPTALKRDGEWPWTIQTDTYAVTFAAMLDLLRERGEALSIRKTAEVLSDRLGKTVDRNQVERAIKVNKTQWENEVAKLTHEHKTPGQDG